MGEFRLDLFDPALNKPLLLTRGVTSSSLSFCAPLTVSGTFVI
jgi:hypothetical protein